MWAEVLWKEQSQGLRATSGTQSADNLGKRTVSKTQPYTQITKTYPKFPFRLLNISNQCHQDTWNLVLNSFLSTGRPFQVSGVLTGKLEGLD